MKNKLIPFHKIIPCHLCAMSPWSVDITVICLVSMTSAVGEGVPHALSLISFILCRISRFSHFPLIQGYAFTDSGNQHIE